MKCPYCQNIIDDDSRWCDQCGKVRQGADVLPLMPRAQKRQDVPEMR